MKGNKMETKNKKISFDIDTILETLINTLFFLGVSVLIIFFLYIGIGLIIYGANYIPPNINIVIRIGALSGTLLLLSAVCAIIYVLRD